MMQGKETIQSLYIRSGLVHRLLQKYPETLGTITFPKFFNEDFPKCLDITALFKVLLDIRSKCTKCKERDPSQAYWSCETDLACCRIASFYADINLSSANYGMFRDLVGITSFAGGVIEFYETQLMCKGKKFTVFDEPAENIAKILNKIKFTNNLTKDLLETLMRKARYQDISRSVAIKLLSNPCLSDEEADFVYEKFIKSQLESEEEIKILNNFIDEYDIPDRFKDEVRQMISAKTKPKDEQKMITIRDTPRKQFLTEIITAADFSEEILPGMVNERKVPMKPSLFGDEDIPKKSLLEMVPKRSALTKPSLLGDE